MRSLSFLCLVACLPGGVASAEPVKLTVLVRGVDSREAVEAVVQVLEGVEGIRFDKDDITPGEKPQYFSDPFVVELSGENYLGQLGKAVGQAPTPNRRKLPPKLNLVLFTGRGIDEPSVMELRALLMGVNGVEPGVSGGLGGRPKLGYYWLQIEDKGGAELADIVEAVKSADLELSLLEDGPHLDDGS